MDRIGLDWVSKNGPMSNSDLPTFSISNFQCVGRNIAHSILREILRSPVHDSTTVSEVCVPNEAKKYFLAI